MSSSSDHLHWQHQPLQVTCTQPGTSNSDTLLGGKEYLLLLQGQQSNPLTQQNAALVTTSPIKANSILHQAQPAQISQSPAIMASTPCDEVYTLLQFSTPNPFSFGTTPQCFPNFVTGFMYWSHVQSLGNKKLAKSMTSYYCWITAIIWKLWATAWGLSTHWNIENNQNQGVACSSLKRI